MTAFLAFIELRTFRSANPSLTVSEVVSGVRELKPAAAGLSLRAGLTLLRVLDESVDWDDSKNGLRLFIFEWGKLAKPLWLRLVPYGRTKLRAALNSNEVQCFRESGLFDDEPDDDAIRWWDEVAALMRGEADTEKMERARHAERLSLNYERDRLGDLGIDREPRWVSLEDNTLGYDILSYDLDKSRIVTRLIEVKSTLADTIIITRNEWNNAASSPERTVFHVWSLPDESLREYAVSEMEENIPLDQCAGRWRQVQISLDS